MNPTEAFNVVSAVVSQNRLNITVQEGVVIAEALKVLSEYMKEQEPPKDE